MRRLLRGIKHLLLGAVLLLLLLCAAEVGLRGYRCARTDREAGSAPGDARSSLVTPSSSTLFQLRPLVSIDEYDSAADSSVTLRTNSLGLRGPEVRLPKPPGVFRILCLGDETTLAPEVAEAESYCGRLQQRLQAFTELEVEVINAGLPAGCPLTCELLLRHRLLGLQPDLIVTHCDPGDAADDALLRPFTYTDEDGAPLAAVHPLLEPAALSLDRWCREFALLDAAREQLARSLEVQSGDASPLLRTELARPVPPPSPPDGDRLDLRQALEPLVRIDRLARGTYCLLVVSTCPSSMDGEPIAETLAADSRRVTATTQSSPPTFAAGLRDLADEHDLLLLDATPRFAGHAELYLADGGNLSAAGHDLYADLLTRFIVERVPGVWTRRPSDPLPALPDVARSPRE